MELLERECHNFEELIRVNLAPVYQLYEAVKQPDGNHGPFRWLKTVEVDIYWLKMDIDGEQNCPGNGVIRICVWQ